MSKAEMPDWPVEIIRSERRKSGVSARLTEGKLIIRAPEEMSDEQLQPIIENLRLRMARRVEPVAETDEALAKRAERLNEKYFEGKLRWQSIRYVKNQTKRHGSCTPSQGTIRLSHHLATLPEWVRDYVIMHELCHLVEANHGPRFWKLVNRYPLTERARGYLMALDYEKATGS
jgi:hypothetical protein